MAPVPYKNSTAPFSLIPISTSRCEVWSFPPTEALRPLRIRINVTIEVSRIGTISIKTGTAYRDNVLGAILTG